MTNELRDRAIGAFIGLAVGDAVGTTVEFKDPGEFEPLTDMVGGGVFRLAPGEWTDDTSMALCLADTLVEHDDVNAFDLLDRFTRWRTEGENSHNRRCFDIGTTCSSAIRSFREDGQLVAPDHDFMSGNGSIMRLAPVATRWFNDEETAAKKAVEQGITTHGSKRCQDACDSLARMLVKLINHPDMMVTEDDDLVGLDAGELDNTGFVTATMIAAEWAFVNTDNFRDCILKAANLGGDADTIAAVAGQLAGAKYGMSGIPKEWLDRLAWKDHIIGLGNKLFDAGLTSIQQS